MEIRPILSVLLRNLTAPLLVAAQIAISLALLLNAMFAVYERIQDARRDSGIAAERDVFFIRGNTWNKLDPKDREAWQNASKRALQAIPGVKSVAMANQMPMGDAGWSTMVASDRDNRATGVGVSAYMSPDSLISTLGMTVVAGRDFDASEVADDGEKGGNARFTIISDVLAKKMFGSADKAVGKSIFMGTGDEAPEMKIVGVVAHLLTINAEHGQDGEYSIILPHRAMTRVGADFVVRTEPGQVDRVMRDAEPAMRKAAPFPLRIRTYAVEAMRAKHYRKDIGLARILTVMAVALLIVTASGVVGMTSFWITRRRKQIGVRRALGARKRDIVRYFLIENGLVSTFGIVAGLGLALWINHLLVAMIDFGYLPLGWILNGAVAMFVLSIVSVLGPALRAASIEPAEATRSV